MSAIANFKKRRVAAKAKTGNAQATITPENIALKLLAQLLGCDELKAIETAQEYVDQNITFLIFRNLGIWGPARGVLVPSRKDIPKQISKDQITQSPSGFYSGSFLFQI